MVFIVMLMMVCKSKIFVPFVDCEKGLCCSLYMSFFEVFCSPRAKAYVYIFSKFIGSFDIRNEFLSHAILVYETLDLVLKHESLWMLIYFLRSWNCVLVIKCNIWIL